MNTFDFNQAVVTLFIGGGAVLLILQICLLATGFEQHEISRIQGALAFIWVPAFFIWGGLSNSEDENSN